MPTLTTVDWNGASVGIVTGLDVTVTSVFFEVGGMEERFRVAFNDVDLGIRIGEHGYRILYTPFAVLEHPGNQPLDALKGLDADGLLQGAAFGMAVYPEDGQDVEALLKQADADMYRQKSDDTGG